MNLPPDYPAGERKLGFEWADDAARSASKALLESKERLSLEDSERMQNDTVSTARPAW